MRKFMIWLVVIVLVLGIAVWFGVPALLGTDWARERVRTALAQNTGRDVELGSVGFTWTGGLSVGDVVVKQKPEHFQQAGPLFQLQDLKLDVSFKELLDKQINLNDVRIDEPSFVLVRDENGDFNFSDLLQKPGEPAPPSPTPEPPVGTPPPTPPTEGPPPSPSGERVRATIKIADGKVAYLDQKLKTRVDLTDFDAKVDYDAGKVVLDGTFVLNGGKGKLLATADLGQKPSPFEIQQFSVDGTELSAELAPMGYIFPLMGNRPQEASGKVKLDLAALRGTGFDLPSLSRTLSGQGSFSLAGGTVMSNPVGQLLGVLQRLGAGDLSAIAQGVAGAPPSEQKLSASLVSSTFRIQDGKIATDNLKVDAAGANIVLAGFTTLEGQLSYDLKLQNLDQLVGKNEKLKQVLGPNPVLPLGLKGTLASPELTIDPTSAIGGNLQGVLEGALRDKLGDKIDEKIPDEIKRGLGGLIPGGKR